MKLLMKEHYRDIQRYLPQGEEVEVSGNLAQWLIDNGKAVKIEPPVIEQPAEQKPEEVIDEARKSNMDNRRRR